MVADRRQAAHRFFPDGLPEVNLLEATGGLVEDFLTVLEAEHFFAENEELFCTGSGGGTTAGKAAQGGGSVEK